MVYILVVTIVSGAFCPPDRKTQKIFQTEEVCLKSRGTILLAIKDTRASQYTHTHTDHL